jgi:exosortase
MSNPAGARRVVVSAWIGAAALVVLLLVPLGTAWKLAPDLGHGWAAPLLMAYLWWERWNERPALHAGRPRAVLWFAAAAAGAAALPLRLLLTPFSLWPALIWVYVLLLVGLGLAAAGLLAGRAGVRWLGGPLVILAGALPWAYQVEQHIIFPLREGMAMLTAEVSNAIGRPAIAAGTSVQLSGGWVGVDEACGGIRSLQASVMLALFFGEWLRFSWGRRILLVVLGVGAALLGNFLRILFLSLRAGEGAAAFFSAHDVAGWLALAFSLTLTGGLAFAWARKTPVRAKDRGAFRGPSNSGPQATGAACWIIFTATFLLLDEGGARLWYARGETGRSAVRRWTVQFPENEMSFKSAPLAENDREMLLPDRYAAGSWALGPGATASAYYIEWQKGQTARFIPFLHNPTVCLPMAGCEMIGSLGVIRVPWSDGEMPFNAYVFRRSGMDLAVAFTIWDPSRGAPLERAAESHSWLEWSRTRWNEVSEARENQPAQLLSLAISGPGARERLLPVLEHLIAEAP